MIRSLVLILLTFSPVSAALYHDYSTYVNRVFSSVAQAENFSRIDFETEPYWREWLAGLDSLLDKKITGSYNAKFLLRFDKLGNISHLKIKELGEEDFDRFKQFLVQLQAIKATPIQGLENFVFELDGSLLYLKRNQQYFAIDTLEAEKLELISPPRLEYPSIGTKLIFRSNRGLLVRAFIKAIEPDSCKLEIYRIGDKLLNEEYVLAIPKKDFRDRLENILAEALAAALSTGIPLAFMSDGILPLTAAVMTTAGTLLEENEAVESFNYSYGDRLRLLKGEGK